LSCQPTTAQRSATLPASNEVVTQLAISSTNSRQIQSNRVAAAIYACINDPSAGDAPVYLPDAIASPTQGSVTISYILILDPCRFAPTYAAVRDMTDKLLTARGAGQVGIHWSRNFVKRAYSLITRFNQT
jgi:hypothetical protein